MHPSGPSNRAAHAMYDLATCTEISDKHPLALGHAKGGWLSLF